MPRTRWLVPLVLGLTAGGCELIGGIEDLKVTGDSGVDSDSTGLETESSVLDGTGGPSDAQRAEAAMMPPDGPSMLPETGPVEASAVPDGCVPMPEDCTNGIDDNCNGLIDCADPQCTATGFSCAPAWPSGWAPVALYDSFVAGGPTPSTPQCNTGDPAYTNLVAVGYYAPIAPTTAPTCTCGCGNLSLASATCSDPVLTTASSGCPGIPAPACSGSVSETAIGTTCTNFMACQNGINGLNLATSSTYTGGASCGTPITTKSVPAWDSVRGWAGAGRVCGPTKAPSTLLGAAAGCPSGDYCLKVPANGLVCITDSTQQSCPTNSLYTRPHTYGSTATDNRTCDFSGCACNVYSSSITCKETVSVYNGSGCSGTAAATLTNLASDGGTPTCYSGGPINLGTAESAQATLVPSGGHCVQAGSGSATGSITPSGTQTTVCCVP